MKKLSILLMALMISVASLAQSKYLTAQEIRDNATTLRIAILNITSTGGKYINGEAKSACVSSDKTLAGVAEPEAADVLVLESAGTDTWYLKRESDNKYLACEAGGNFTLVDAVTSATAWSILGKDDDGFGSLTGYDDLFTDIDKSLNDYMIRFIANKQYMNGQAYTATGGLRGGTGAWSINYVRNADYSDPVPTTYNVSFSAGEGGTASMLVLDPQTFTPTTYTESPVKFAESNIGFTFNIQPDDNFEIDAFTVDGVDAKSSLTRGTSTWTYTCSAVSDDMDLAVTFKSTLSEPFVTLKASATDVMVGTTVTFDTNALNFSGTPETTISYTVDGSDAQTLEGTTFTPEAAGTYIFTATATYNTETASSDPVTVTVSEKPESVTIENGAKYQIALYNTTNYLTTTVVADGTNQTISIQADPETFQITGSEADGWQIMSTTNESYYVGIGTNDWDAGNNSTTKWDIQAVDGLDNTFTIYRHNGTKGLGADEPTAGSGVFTDKNASTSTQHPNKEHRWTLTMVEKAPELQTITYTYMYNGKQVGEQATKQVLPGATVPAPSEIWGYIVESYTNEGEIVKEGGLSVEVTLSKGFVVNVESGSMSKTAITDGYKHAWTSLSSTPATITLTGDHSYDDGMLESNGSIRLAAPKSGSNFDGSWTLAIDGSDDVITDYEIYFTKFSTDNASIKYGDTETAATSDEQVFTVSDVNEASSTFYVTSSGNNNKLLISKIIVHYGSTTPAIKGDVNGDGEVNVADITAILAVMYETDMKYAATADANGDGEVNVADVTTVLGIMYGTTE